MKGFFFVTFAYFFLFSNLEFCQRFDFNLAYEYDKFSIIMGRLTMVNKIHLK